MEHNDDRANLNIRKNRTNITIGLAIVFLIGLSGLAYVVFQKYYNEHDSNPTVMNKNLKDDN